MGLGMYISIGWDVVEVRSGVGGIQTDSGSGWEWLWLWLFFFVYGIQTTGWLFEIWSVMLPWFCMTASRVLGFLIF